MQFNLPLDIAPLPRPITYQQTILLTGSCFTEHISDRLGQHKFSVVSNPHGILFNPLSVASSLLGYINGELYAEGQLFYLNELWNSWDHHTRFSNIRQADALAAINESQQQATEAVKQAGVVVMTLGSAFQYYLLATGQPVANNHRAPAQWFEKRMLSTQDIINALAGAISELNKVNNGVQVILTISPVRHIRDGVVENNRSKARLISAVQELCSMFHNVYYFPAYELVIDVLRDHRFYDIDLVHPNFQATSYVWDCFAAACIDPQERQLMTEVHEVVIARKHRPRFPETAAHNKFKAVHALKCKRLMDQHPQLDLNEELSYFEAD